MKEDYGNALLEIAGKRNNLISVNEVKVSIFCVVCY